METICFDCTKYDPTDQTAAVLAYLSSAPYFAFFYQLVVVYSRRELHGITTLLGIMTNAALSKALKRLIRQHRPLERCSLLDNCAKFGMPSSHAQLMIFVWALHALFVFRGPAAGSQRLLHLIESTALAITSVGVSYGRVYLGYHDTSQVTLGAVVGVALAAIWFAVTAWLAQHWFKHMVSWRLCQLLHIKDTFPLGPNVLRWEREQCMATDTKTE